MNLHRTPTRKGFTLIEMLVVIAIIALLASILIPAITGALARAQRLRLSASGGGVYKQIFSAATENYGSRTTYWAQTTPDTQYENYTANSTDYFRWLMTPFDIDNPANGAGVLQQDFSMFEAPNTDKVSTVDEITTEGNPWVVTAGLSETSNSGIPFMFTKNMSVPSDQLPTWGTPGTLIPTSMIPQDTSPEDNPPYGREALIVVRVGGGADVLNDKQMYLDAFNPGGNTSVTNPDDNAVLLP